MRLLELMERIGSRDTKLIAAYIEDAFQEIQELSRENKQEGYISIVSGVEDYNYPAGIVQLTNIKINDNSEDSYNKYEWKLVRMGRTFKLYKKASDGDWDAPDVSVTNGIELEYTTRGYVFVYNPDGDSSIYTYTTAQTSAVAEGAIVYVADGVRADYAIRYHYYERKSGAGALSSCDLSGVNYKDTTYWEDVTEISSPDEDSFINCGEDLIRAVEHYVRYKIADSSNDLKLAQYREQRFFRDAARTVKNKMGSGIHKSPPKAPFRLV